MQKADSKGSAGTADDSGQNDEFTSDSQHSRKPPVVGSQCHGTPIESHVVGLPSLSPQQNAAFSKCFDAVKGLTYKEAEKLLYELMFALKKVATIAA